MTGSVPQMTVETGTSTHPDRHVHSRSVSSLSGQRLHVRLVIAKTWIEVSDAGHFDPRFSNHGRDRRHAAAAYPDLIAISTIACDTPVMVLFRPKCPVDPTERAWIDKSMEWFVDEFGEAVLRRPLVLPRSDVVPVTYSGTESDVRRLVRNLCNHMEIDHSRIAVEVQLRPDVQLRDAAPAFVNRGTGEAGHYLTRDGQTVISIAFDKAQHLAALVAAIAHELCHERLLGEGRVTSTRPDHEPLTDLLTVYFGLGIFSANASFEFVPYTRGVGYGWSASRLGYLTELMYGYALARYASMRGEAAPAWAKYVDVNPRVHMKKSLKYLHSLQTQP